MYSPLPPTPTGKLYRTYGVVEGEGEEACTLKGREKDRCRSGENCFQGNAGKTPEGQGGGFRMERAQSAGASARQAAEVHPRCGKGFHPPPTPSQLSVQTLLTVSVQPPCAIAGLNVCARVKNPKHWQPDLCLDTSKYRTVDSAALVAAVALPR